MAEAKLSKNCWDILQALIRASVHNGRWEHLCYDHEKEDECRWLEEFIRPDFRKWVREFKKECVLREGEGRGE
jgi:hypothetical protein